MAKGKILVVGDESVTALDLKNRFNGWGYEVIAIAQIGEEAIKKTVEIGPDLVLMDVGRDRSEVETARQICSWLDIPLLYLTTDANAHLITQLNQTPFSSIRKPVEDRELRLIIEFSLYKHRREKEIAAVQEQAQRESLLRLVTNQIHQTLNLEVILQTAVREVRQLLKTSRVVVYQFMADWQGEVVIEDVDSRWKSALGDMSQDDCFSGEYAHLYKEGRVRAINNIQQADLDTCHINFLQRLQVQANLIVPIVIGPKLWGLLIAHECSSPRVWQAWEIELLQQLALQLAIAIHQAELYQQAQAAVAQSQAQAEQLQAALNQLQATQLQLIQSEKLSSLGQMVAGVAHEINNAITFIHSNLPHAQTYAQLLSKALIIYQTAYPQPPTAFTTLNTNLEIDYVLTDFPNLLQSMESGTKRICEIVLTLRNFSRLDEAQRKPVDLHEGIESTLVILQHRLKTGVKLDKQYGDLPLVECHAGQINQVFLNLLTNALDAAGEQAEITIRTQHYPDRVEIAIRDNGPGIPLEIQLRIFDPFFTTKEVGKGTGLGLSICHQIICQGHHGQLRCISQPGQGAEFQIELPTVKSSFEF